MISTCNNPFYSYWASIFIQLSVFVFLLDWLSYNFKSSRSNVLTSHSKKFSHKVLIVKIALGSFAHWNVSQKPLPANFINNKLANGYLRAASQSNSSLTPISWVFSYTSTLGQTFIFILEINSTISNQVNRYINENI